MAFGSWHCMTEMFPVKPTLRWLVEAALGIAALEARHDVLKRSGANPAI